ncbi:MAG TPA: ABC transporter substrate-binding protein [Patescibacteria group bacterium]|nr:ABC transporter substrate-binding protein [Patescibacteria group bacterium]
MTAFRRWRIFYLVVIELAQKYTKALLGGFVAGFLLSMLFSRVYPFIAQQWLTQTDRIGIVGEFTPNLLPLAIQNQISYGLTRLNEDGSVSPGLATSWVATDSGKIFTFYLRKDVNWHDGKPVTAQDINYNIKNVTFTVVNNSTIHVILDNPYSPFPVLLSKPLFKPGLDGFGLYKVVSIQLNGDKVSYIKLGPVTSKINHGKVLEYRFYPTEAAAILAYKLGEIDTINDLSAPNDLSHWGKTTVDEVTRYNRIVTLFFNLSDQLLADKSLRQTLAISLPDFPGERADSPISKKSWAYTDKIKTFVTNMGLAKKDLASEKISSESANLTITTFSQYIDVAQSIADNWTSIGIPTSVKVVNVLPSDYQILLSAQELPPDPDQYPFWHSTQTQTNITGYSNVKIDKLLEDGRQELDTTKRIAIYADFQRRLVDEAPALFLYYAKSYTVRRAL